MFKPARGSKSNPRVYPIATGTVIELGEVVKLTNGLVVPAGDGDSDDPYLGVSAEAHDGSTSGRNVGLEIFVYDCPKIIYGVKYGKLITATSGSTTTFVDSNMLPATNDLFNGGKLKLISVAADASLNGKELTITDFVGSGGTFTLSETLGSAIASGDTAYLVPGDRCKGQYGWDLDYTDGSTALEGTRISWESSGGEALYYEGSDPERFITYWRLRLHARGSHPAAL